MFYSTQDPERIIELINKYPMFRQMYGDVYEVCRNMEKVMGMFSEELREMDRNTVQYMIDEMQATIDAQSAVLEEEKKRHEEEQKRNKEENNKLQELIATQAAALEKALKRIEELERKNGSEPVK
ncbi:hypothetical protein [Eisenbergiella massiliensis]|nr:hypothetical protein [Eisenbergiella massiliensis]